MIRSGPSECRLSAGSCVGPAGGGRFAAEKEIHEHWKGQRWGSSVEEVQGGLFAGW